MRPLGLSFFQMVSDISMTPVGGRLYFDVSSDLASALGRKVLLASMSRIDPLMHNALLNLRARNGFVKFLPRGGKRGIRLGTGYFSWSFLVNIITLSRRDDGSIISKLMAENKQSVRELRQRLADVTGEAFTQIEAEQERIRQVMYDARSMAAVYTGLLASELGRQAHREMAG